MKLKNLTMKNFLNHANTRVDFAPVTMIFGGNDQGKSSIRDAIQYATTGLCRGVSKKNQSAVYAKDGGSDFEVSLETDTAKLTRTQTNRGGDVIPVDVVSVLTNPWAIIQMPTEDRQEFFTKHLTVAEAKKINLGIDVDSREFALVIQILNGGDIDSAEREAIGVRRGIKRLIEANVIPAIPESSIKVGESMIDLSIVNGQYSAKYDQRVNERAKLTAQLAMIGEASEADLKAQQQAKESWIKEQEQAVAEIDKTLEANLIKMPELNKTVKDYEKTIVEIDGQIKAYNSLIERARKSVGVCPLTAGKATIECSQFKHPSASLAGQIELSIKDLHGQATKIAAPLANTKGELKRITDENRVLHQEKESTAETIKSAKNEIVEIGRQIAAISQREAIRLQISDLDGKISSLKTIIDSAATYREATSRVNTAKAESDRLAKLLAQAEQVCSILGPDGTIRANAASQAEGIKFDELAAAWGLDSLKLSRDGEIILHNRPVELANKAQQYRVGVVIAQLLARKHGFMVIDEFDQLKQNFQASLMQRLPVWKDEFSVVILTAVDTIPQPAKVGWVKKYWVENGTVSEVRA